MQYLILCRSLTYAQRAASELARRGISASVVKAPQRLRERGCGYALSLSRHFSEAVEILKAQDLLTGRLYAREDGGDYTEVLL